jgi:hypothetical protein
MKNLIQLIAVTALGIFLTGCIVISKNEQPVVVQPASPEAVVCAEIDAAGKLDFDSSRGAALDLIAARKNLAPSVQVHLVNTIFRRLSFENSKMSVLQTLVKNPSFSNAAKQSILAQLPKLNFDSNKSALLRWINDRGELKA